MSVRVRVRGESTLEAEARRATCTRVRGVARLRALCIVELGATPDGRPPHSNRSRKRTRHPILA